MQSVSRAAAATLVAVAAIGGAATGWPAGASPDPAINGTYLATSNGEWAKTNDIYHDEDVIRSTWTIASSCSDPFTCDGTVTSDQGWTADLDFKMGTWYVHRDLPNWETCWDGTAATGRQIYRFYPWDAAQNQIVVGSPILVGEDKTTGPSGACGWNKLLEVRMPFKLVKIA
jgi:hypothetical protein